MGGGDDDDDDDDDEATAALTRSVAEQNRLLPPLLLWDAPSAPSKGAFMSRTPPGEQPPAGRVCWALVLFSSSLYAAVTGVYEERRRPPR